jgi:hypothetical protein
MGCKNQEDSLKYYTRCPAIRNWASKRLQLHLGVQQAPYAWSHTAPLPKGQLLTAAHVTHAAYRATNHFRAAGIISDHGLQQQEATN